MDKPDKPVLLPRATRRFHAWTNQRRRFRAGGSKKHFGDDQKFFAYLREQPKHCSCRVCGNPRRFRYYTIYEYEKNDTGSLVFAMKRRGYVSAKERLTLAERRAEVSFREQLEELHTI